MFDTIKMKTTCFIHPSKLSHAEPFTYLKNDIPLTRYKFKEKPIPSIEYTDYNQNLEIQLSIPKYLYGNNVNLIRESDIPLFFQRLHEQLQDRFDIRLSQEEWYLQRLDVCWNFPVQEHMDLYLKQLANIKLKHLYVETHGIKETVIHRNKSRRISFYNKQKECIRKNQPIEIIDQAEGLLRMEINVTGKQLSKYSATRKANHFLTMDFFNYITQPIMKQVKFPPTIQGISLHWLETHSCRINQVETVLGFQALHNWFSASELMQLYNRNTYKRRLQMAKENIFPNQVSLKPLHIDLSKLA